MPGFGDLGLQTLYVTSANHSMPEAERARHPEEGNLFRLPAPVPGLPESRFILGLD
jgi:sugar lactone lactonase YvrE